MRLVKTYEEVPEIEMAVGEDGQILAGSYNFSIQLLDQDLNPSNWITTTPVVKIYNDTQSKEFGAIRGSTNRPEEYRKFPRTTKSVELTISNLDPDYPYYRIAVIESNAGTGQITGVKYTRPLSAASSKFIYTGDNSMESNGTQEEILLFNSFINSAEKVEQLENRLTLSNVKGSPMNLCKLQKYASKISSDVVYDKSIILDATDNSNGKSALQDAYFMGYMPGEIYPFGIVYTYEGGETPVFHIPGANSSSYDGEMDTNNSGVSTYPQVTSCDSDDYWGVDYTGASLINKPVRHHRFPSRSDLGIDLIKSISGGQAPMEPYKIIIHSVVHSSTTLPCVGGYAPGTVLIIGYKKNGVQQNDYQRVFFADGTVEDLTVITSDEELELTSIRAVAGDVDVSSQEINDFGSYVEHRAYAQCEGDGSFNNQGSSSIDANVRVEIPQPTFLPNRVNSQPLGIRFSNIQKPSPEALGGVEITGYYIVRPERVDEEKTIIDNAVALPLSMLEDSQYVVQGPLVPNRSPNTSFIKSDMFAMISPEAKFNKKELTSVDRIVTEGQYLRNKRVLSLVTSQDVGEGTSYDPEIHKKGEADYDGFDLAILTRDNQLVHETYSGQINFSEIESVFSLNALDSRTVQDIDDETKIVFNAHSDNRSTIVKSSVPIDTAYLSDRLPYLILKRDLIDHYANFMSVDYLVVGKHNKFESASDTIEVYGGDANVVSMKYAACYYNDNVMASRDKKRGIWSKVLGVLAVIGGALLTTVNPVAGAMVVGYGLSKISSGISEAAIAKAYGEAYGDKGDNKVSDVIEDLDLTNSFEDDPEDDQVQWMGEALNNLWIETSVKVGLRHGNTTIAPDFLNSPSQLAEEGNSTEPATTPVNILDNYFLEKLTILDGENQSGRLYQGFANAEIYEVNPDYMRLNKEKIYTMIGLDYDCCSDCLEDFPQRIVYSQQSFQEESTDNYRVFLPNNYRDVEGEKGAIKDVWKIQNNLFIQTEEALWSLPQNLQERVTDEIVSFIGTGDFFSIPPRKIVDSEFSSGGTTQSFSRTKTEFGVIYISEDQRTIYLFNGQELKPISKGNGMTNWFENNIPLKFDKAYRDSKGRKNPFENQPYSKYGTGFTTAYDPVNERILVTKRDYQLIPELLDDDCELCYDGGGTIKKWDDYNNMLQTRKDNGWTLGSVKDCVMYFYKEVLTDGDYETLTETEVAAEYTTKSPVVQDFSWTLSYSLKSNSWTSFHSFIPRAYRSTSNNFMSWQGALPGEDRGFYSHNVDGNFLTYYGTKYEFVIDVILNPSIVESSMIDWIKFHTNVSQKVDGYWTDLREVTFSNIVAYNSRQSTGELRIDYKQEQAQDFLANQIDDFPGTVQADREDRTWMINDLRDIRIDYSKPLFLPYQKNMEDEGEATNLEFKDKTVNDSSLSFVKPWYELEPMKDKFLALRMIFNNFDNIKLSLEYITGVITGNRKN